MSVRTHRNCDRCAAPCGPDRLELLVEHGGIDRHEEGGTIDLCARCRAQLARWLTAPALSHPPLRRSVRVAP